MGDLIDVLTAWFSGRQTTTLTLWGLPMLWWGRIGKALQFLAGCAVVLDLIGPDRMRAAAARAANHRHRAEASAQRLRDLRVVEGLRLAVRDRIVLGKWEVGARSRYEPTHWELAAESHSPIPGQQFFSRTSVATLRRDVLGALPEAHDCAEDHGQNLCKQQVRFVDDRVTEYVGSRLPTYLRELLRSVDEVEREQRRGYVAWMILVGVLMPAALACAFAARGVSVLSGVLGGCGLFAVMAVYMVPEVWLCLRSAPVVMVTRFGVTLLERLLPGHKIRWVAFFLFILGFGLDLLAS